MRGTYTMATPPLANVKIVRKTSYNTIKSSWVEDEFYTDEYGYFNTPAKEAAMKLTFLDQFLAITKLLVELESETLLVMESDRMESRSEEHTSNSSHVRISYAVFCLKKKKIKNKYNIEQKKQKKRNQSQLTSKAVPTTLPRNMHVSYAEI